MPEIGGRIGEHVNERGNNVRTTVSTLVENTRDLANDIKERIDLNLETEPKKTFRGVLGERGSIPDCLTDYAVKQADTLERHVQEFARINRKWFVKR